MKLLFVQKMNGISGSELYMLQIMPELKRRGYEVEMLIVYPVTGYNNKRFIEYLGEHGIPTHEIYNHNSASPLLYWKIYRLLKKGEYDIVQANLVHADFWISAIKFFMLRNLKVLSVKHGYYPAYQAKYGNDLKKVRHNAYYWIEKFVCRTVNFNVTISMGLYDVFVKGGITEPSRIRNIYYGLTLSAPVEKVVPLNIPVGPFVLITGRLVGFKGHRYLIDSWKRVKETCPELKLYIAGEGDLRAILEKQVADSGLQSDIIFLGHVPNPHPLMEKCLFTLVTSSWEGFGLILLESWLHKKAIVAFDAPAMNEVIEDSVNGLLAKANDTKSLAEKIVYLYQNPALGKEFGENGYNKLNNFYTLKRMTDETEEVYAAINSNQPVPLHSSRIAIHG